MSRIGLDQAFGIDTFAQVVPNNDLNEAPVVPRPAPELTPEDTSTDIDYVRRTLQFTTERAQQLVDLAIANCADASNPRDIEVAANTLNTCASISEKLIKLHNDVKNLTTKPQPIGSGNTFVNANSVFLTSSDLLKQLTETDEEK